jgi:hypothetical protein
MLFLPVRYDATETGKEHLLTHVEVGAKNANTRYRYQNTHLLLSGNPLSFLLEINKTSPVDAFLQRKE